MISKGLEMESTADMLNISCFLVDRICFKGLMLRDNRVPYRLPCICSHMVPKIELQCYGIVTGILTFLI